jgi:cytochrome c-type biogenesis protein CcmH
MKATSSAFASLSARLTAGVCGLVLAATGMLLVGNVAQAQQSDRAKQIGKRLLCMCGCNQILTACNHVGCTTSASMLKKLDQLVERGSDSDDLIIQAFVQEFGTQVYAEPPSKGINRIAWFLPTIALLMGLGLVILVIVRWRQRPATAPAAPKIPAEMLARARERAELETNE